MAELRIDTEKEAVRAAVGTQPEIGRRCPAHSGGAARRIDGHPDCTAAGGQGAGEIFWQYRRLPMASLTECRLAALGARRPLYVREREWRLPISSGFFDRSPSMDFNSHLTEWSKLDRALVVSFALAEVLVQGGERVGIPELMRPPANCNVIEKMAQATLHDAGERPSLPPNFAPAQFSEVLLVSDCGAQSGSFAAPSVSLRRTEHAVMSCRSSIRQRKASLIPGASNLLYVPEGSGVSPAGVPICGAPTIRRSSPITAPRCAPRPTVRLDIHCSSYQPRTYGAAVR